MIPALARLGEIRVFFKKVFCFRIHQDLIEVSTGCRESNLIYTLVIILHYWLLLKD
jgi:hypothetical protein